MSRPRTSICRMWEHGAGTDTSVILPAPLDGRTFGKAQPVLVLPYNPAARAAMIDRVVKSDPSISRATVEYVLATALTP